MSDATSEAPSPPCNRRSRIALSVLLVLAFFAAAYVAAPLWAGLVLGTTMAFVLEPVYRRITPRVPHRAAAMGLTLFTGLACIGVGAGVLSLFLKDLVALGSSMQRYMLHGNLVDLIGERGVIMLDRMGVDRELADARIQRELTSASRYTVDLVATILNSAAHALVGLTMALCTMYYVLLEWPGITHRLERILPIYVRHTRALLNEFRVIGRTALVGTIATAIVQGALGGIGYAALGVPQPVVWGVLTAFASLVPLVGTSLVWGPIAIHLLLSGRTVAAFFLLFYGLLIVMALADYVIRPRLVDRTDQGQPLLVLVSVLGGIETLGPIGLFMGPILMSFFLAVLRLYERETGGPRPDATRVVEPTAALRRELARPSPPSNRRAAAG